MMSSEPEVRVSEPKVRVSENRFTPFGIMLQLIGIDHVHDFGSIRSKIIVI
jgi:hypothetical protein